MAADDDHWQPRCSTAVDQHAETISRIWRTIRAPLWERRTHLPVCTTHLKPTSDQFQDGGQPPYFRPLNRYNSATDCVLISLTSLTESWNVILVTVCNHTCNYVITPPDESRARSLLFWTVFNCDSDSHLRDSRSALHQQCIGGWLRGVARKLTLKFHSSLPYCLQGGGAKSANFGLESIYYPSRQSCAFVTLWFRNEAKIRNKNEKTNIILWATMNCYLQIWCCSLHPTLRTTPDKISPEKGLGEIDCIIKTQPPVAKSCFVDALWERGIPKTHFRSIPDWRTAPIFSTSKSL